VAEMALVITQRQAQRADQAQVEKMLAELEDLTQAEPSKASDGMKP